MKTQAKDWDKIARDVAEQFDCRDFIEAARKLGELSNEACDVLRQTYKERRKCTAIKKNGQPCKAWALWDCLEQLCSAHYYITRGPELSPEERIRQEKMRRRPTCNCAAYDWPHKPNSGFCRWPAEPLDHYPVRSGQRSFGKMRRRDLQALEKRVMGRLEMESGARKIV